MSSTTLTTPQLRSLFDILVHTETYAEVESFKDPEAIDRYGYPFTKQSPKANKDVAPSASPLLQLLLTRIVLPVPGVKDFGPGFWSDKFRGIMKSFGEAELSESYEKGTLGTRKRLASAASVVHESITRGILGGAPRKPSADLHGHYDLKKAQDLDRAWSDGVHHLVYGNLVDGLFDRLTETPDLEGHSPVVSAAADYAIIHIATLLHHVLVLSAEGPYLLKLLEDVHKLIPYSVLGQTLRVGNAATMISGGKPELYISVGPTTSVLSPELLQGRVISQ
ncbi:PX-associated-domain-containing protein [Xylariomycetidae sp. FL2044]|nr:PX-associated-domain-containing protein [Xylariomycetidae sp. FL2044]